MSTTDFVPNTRVTILRTIPTDLVDEYGDAMDNETPASSGHPASLIQQSSKQHHPADRRLTVVDNYELRLRANVDVKDTDRIKDEKTGSIYMIERMVHPSDPNGPSAIHVELVKAD